MHAAMVQRIATTTAPCKGIPGGKYSPQKGNYGDAMRAIIGKRIQIPPAIAALRHGQGEIQARCAQTVIHCKSRLITRPFPSASRSGSSRAARTARRAGLRPCPYRPQSSGPAASAPHPSGAGRHCGQRWTHCRHPHEWRALQPAAHPCPSPHRPRTPPGCAH